MLNKVILIGRITAEIEIRKTSNDIPFSYFTLAVNRPGQTDKTDFISCVAWRNTAELMAKYLKKGSSIAIEGRLEVFRSEKEGVFETRTTVNVSSIEFLERKTSTTQEMNLNNSSTSSVDVKMNNNKEANLTQEIDFDELSFT